nr:immune-associated nucleotide-binding protein 9-like isoform X2 [Crassostrea gigas]
MAQSVVTASSYDPKDVQKEDLEGNSMAESVVTASSDDPKDVQKEDLKGNSMAESVVTASSDDPKDVQKEDLKGNSMAESVVTASSDDPKDVQKEDLKGNSMAQSVVTASSDDPKDVQKEDLEDDEGEYRMMIAGLTGVGKSSLANSISGKHVQITESALASVTKQAAIISCKRQEKSLVYFDTPGLSFDTDKEFVPKEYRKCLINAAPGLQAILIVQKATAFTEDNQTFLDRFTKWFGENCWKWVVFVFTHIDEFENTDLEEQLKTVDKRLKCWLSKCENRYVGIDNNLKGTENNKQIERLISVVTNLIETNNGEIYTNEEFQKIYKIMQNTARDENLTLREVRERYLGHANNIITNLGRGLLRELLNIHI